MTKLHFRELHIYDTNKLFKITKFGDGKMFVEISRIINEDKEERLVCFEPTKQMIRALVKFVTLETK